MLWRVHEVVGMMQSPKQSYLWKPGLVYVVTEKVGETDTKQIAEVLNLSSCKSLSPLPSSQTVADSPGLT